MKELIKKWWFWLIIVIVIAIIIALVSKFIEEKEIEEKFSKMGKSTTDFTKGIDDAKSHLDEFKYNYETGQVEYTPSK